MKKYMFAMLTLNCEPKKPCYTQYPMIHKSESESETHLFITFLHLTVRIIKLSTETTIVT